MSRLRDKGLRAALSALIAWLLALGLGLPLLKGFGLEGQMLRFAVCTAGLSGVFSLLRTRKYLFSLSLLLAAAAAGVHYLLGGGWIQSALNAGNAIAMHLRGAGVALPLYGDTIALQLTLYCALLGTALASPDNGLYAPIFIVGSLLCSMWQLGLPARICCPPCPRCCYCMPGRMRAIPRAIRPSAVLCLPLRWLLRRRCARCPWRWLRRTVPRCPRWRS